MLKRVHKSDGVTTYEHYYDPGGSSRIRKEKWQNSQLVEVANYIIDANTTYVQVILEIPDQNGIIASYTYGDDLLKVSRDGDYLYWYDGLGSVRIITDIAGAIANRYTYDGYGNLIDGEYAETITNECKFTGERADTETGFVYLRARMYELCTGRFLTRDPFAGIEGDPPSLHKHLYCHDDPANGVDRSGETEFSLRNTLIYMAAALITVCALNLMVSWFDMNWTIASPI